MRTWTSFLPSLWPQRAPAAGAVLGTLPLVPSSRHKSLKQALLAMPADPFWLFIGHRLHSQNHLRYWPSGKSVALTRCFSGRRPPSGDRVICGILLLEQSLVKPFNRGGNRGILILRVSDNAG